MPLSREQGTGRFINIEPLPWQVFIEDHSALKEFLLNKPEGTKENYGSKIQQFTKDTGISPEAYQELDRLQARDAAWNYVKPFVGKTNAKASNYLSALKSLYRNKNGETLPFDSRRGGKHYIPKRRIKAAYEHVPNKAEMYLLIEAARTIRDKAVLLFLFESGVRVNVIEHLKFKHVKNQLYPEIKIPLTLKITDQLDTKMQGYDLPFYYTFLQGEAVETLKIYCDNTHKNDKDNTPLFLSSLGNSLDQSSVWEIVKRCTKRAGLDPSTIWTHTIRRAFKAVVRRSVIVDDFKEAIMGHRLEGSQENYFSRNNPEDLAKEYMRINFGRTVPKSRLEIMEKEIMQKNSDVETLKKELSTVKSSVQFLLTQEEKLKYIKHSQAVNAEVAPKIVKVKPHIIYGFKENKRLMQLEADRLNKEIAEAKRKLSDD